MKLSAPLALLALLVPHAALAADPTRVRLPAGLSWANLAWGFNNGGRDEVAGRKLVLVDAFDASAAEVSSLHEDGHIVMCYISAGSAEKWRPDFDALKPLAMSSMQAWPDEFYLDISRPEALTQLMVTRLEMAAAKGCDAVEPDNMDCYSNSDCFNKLPAGANTARAARALQIVYVRMLAAEAHALGLAIAMKNAAEIVPDVHESFDAVVTENCRRWQECDSYRAFTDSGRAHMNTEYVSRERADLCGGADWMQTKHCVGNSGEWLCKGSVGGAKVKQWEDCTAAEQPLPPTQYTGTDVVPDEPMDDTPTDATLAPTAADTEAPTQRPSRAPVEPKTARPTRAPAVPTARPTRKTRAPTTTRPTKAPTTPRPSKLPTTRPTHKTQRPSLSPTALA